MGEDEDQIRRTLGAYSQRCDDGRFDEWSDLFTEDARMCVGGQVTEGRQAIRAAMAAMQPDGARGKHITANSLIDVDVDGDTATAATDYVFVRRGPDGLAIVAAGRYHDRLVRQGSQWRFSDRTVTQLGDGAGAPDR